MGNKVNNMKTKIMSVREFRNKMSRILGESEIIITKDGVPTARVVPLSPMEKLDLLTQKTKNAFKKANISDEEIEEMYLKARGKKN